MAGSELYWVDGPWPGRLALAARPRGGDWLGDEIAGWHRTGVDRIVSLLTQAEQADLDLRDEAQEASAQGVKFTSFPIPDLQVPSSEGKLASMLEELDADLSRGSNVVIHCRQGVGRSGLVAACLLITKGLRADAAIKKISSARGEQVPETREQRTWIEHYAEVLADTK